MSAKRFFDVITSPLLFLLLLPVILCIACLVWLDSPGPIIFRQERLGRNKIPFVIYKFRTMQDGAEEFGCRTIKGDTRITRVGRFLRRSHLDELPQLWNVIKGEMSLVGPRPLSAKLVAESQLKVPDYDARLTVLPGMTGPAQTAGRMEQLPDGVYQSFLLDLYYIKDQNFFLDLKILAKTFFAVLKLQGV